MDSFHPALSIIQMLVDATDPVNYSPYWLAPATGGTPKHVFVTEGTEDHASPAAGTNAMAAAGGVPLIRPVALASPPHALRGLAEVDLPVQDNVLTPAGQRRTAGLRQWDGGDHWVAEEDALAMDIWATFLRTLATSQTATIDD